MINPKMQQALNLQINRELYSAYLYLAMAAYFESVGLGGCANWMAVQAQEELTHVQRFYRYLVERGGRVSLDAVAKPPAEWASALNAFEEALKHEGKVTGYINQLVSFALAEEDHATNNFLQWFVAEQVEEEASAEGVVQRLRLVGESPGGLLMVDRELAGRVFTPPPAAGDAAGA
ncbi:MAG: ferritin [bacterium]|nr:ferritin [bacterium]